jgi:serine/threonine protein kinase
MKDAASETAGPDPTETLTVTAGDTPSPAAAEGRVDKELLLERFQEILRARAIYYPVAYDLRRQVGRGRQGVVFLGVHNGARGCSTRYAIKVFDPSVYREAEGYWTDMGRIASQISRLQSERSPYLVSREGYEESGGIGYTHMEFIDGIDLRQLLGRSHLRRAQVRASRKAWAHFTDVIFRVGDEGVCFQPGVAIYIMRRVLRGLEQLHLYGFAHGDVKPANCMVDRLGNVKVIDYGRAVRLGERVSLLFGTPYYMAPEIHERERAQAQSDLYSVGILGLELLMGRRLTNARTEEDLLAFKRTLPERLKELLPPHVLENSYFVDMLHRLISASPEGRYASAREAESGTNGLSEVHRQLVKTDQDAEYGRELENYMAKLVDPRTNEVEK